MSKKISIAIDAMGGENSPRKTIEGVSIFIKKNIHINQLPKIWTCHQIFISHQRLLKMF